MTTVRRFLHKITKHSTCWIWHGPHDQHGYGRFFVQGESQMYAHRVIMILLFNGLPKGLNVLHSCDTPACVNPNHLWLGTQNDNIHDMDIKKRRVTVAPKGEAQGLAKLTAAIVNSIRAQYVIGKITYDDIGRQYGISKTHVGNIVNRRVWRHI